MFEGSFPYNFFALCRAFLLAEGGTSVRRPSATHSNIEGTSDRSSASMWGDIWKPGDGCCLPVNLTAVQKLHSAIVAAARAVRSDSSNSAGRCLLLLPVAVACCCCLWLCYCRCYCCAASRCMLHRTSAGFRAASVPFHVNSVAAAFAGDWDPVELLLQMIYGLCCRLLQRAAALHQPQQLAFIPVLLGKQLVR